MTAKLIVTRAFDYVKRVWKEMLEIISYAELYNMI